MAVSPPNNNPNPALPNPNSNVTRCELPLKSNGFFGGPCATFSVNFVKSV